MYNIMVIQPVSIHLFSRSNEICNIYYGKLPSDIITLLMPDLLLPVMFCSDGNVNNAIGTCHGDSGGPLIRKYEVNFLLVNRVILKDTFVF